MTDTDALHRYARTGDAEAFALLVDRYEALVFHACRRQLASADAVEDAVQETFLRLARHARRVRHNLAAWLHITATNICRDMIRRDASRRRREFAWATETPAADTDAPAREVLAALDDALAALPADQRELLVQHYYASVPQKQLADAAAISPPALNKRVRTALDALREQLGARGVSAPAGAVAGVLALDAAAMEAPSAALHATIVKCGLVGAATGGGALWPIAAAVALAGLLAGGGYLLATDDTAPAPAPGASTTGPVIPDLPDPPHAIAAPASLSPAELGAALEQNYRTAWEDLHHVFIEWDQRTQAWDAQTQEWVATQGKRI